MTQETSNSLIPVTRDQITIASAIVLSQDECDLLEKYIKSGGHELHVDTVGKFFELFLNGSDCLEIHRLNKPFPLESILWARVKYHWDAQKDAYVIQKQLMIRDKVLKAQLEATDLVADMLVVARKQHGDRLKKFIQTGDEKDLGGAMRIESMQTLVKTIESLLKITGQDRNIKNTNVTENKQTVDVNVNANVSGTQASLNADDAAKILSIVADAKRREGKDGK
jgi:hypothetical protein